MSVTDLNKLTFWGAAVINFLLVFLQLFVKQHQSLLNVLSHTFYLCLQMHDIVKAVGNCSYNQLVEKIISCKQSDNSELAGEGKCFLYSPDLPDCFLVSHFFSFDPVYLKLERKVVHFSKIIKIFFFFFSFKKQKNVKHFFVGITLDMLPQKTTD